MSVSAWRRGHGSASCVQATYTSATFDTGFGCENVADPKQRACGGNGAGSQPLPFAVLRSCERCAMAKRATNDEIVLRCGMFEVRVSGRFASIAALAGRFAVLLSLWLAGWPGDIAELNSLVRRQVHRPNFR